MNFNDRYYYDDGLLISKHTGNILCNMDSEGYIRIRVSGKEYRAHRIIWEMHNGPIPEGMLVDHIDRDVYNNRIENLRLATRQQNNANSSKKIALCTPGIPVLPKGVTRTGSNTYRVKLYHKYTCYCLGSYSTPEEAGQVYKDAADVLNGEYAMTQ